VINRPDGLRIKMLWGLILIVGGLALSYFGWRASTLLNDIDDHEEWEDAVYGIGGGGAEMGWLGIALGALMIFMGIVKSLRFFY
jgi:hypothetical protein